LQFFDLASVSFCHDALVETWTIPVGSTLLLYVDLCISSNLYWCIRRVCASYQKKGMDMHKRNRFAPQTKKLLPNWKSQKLLYDFQLLPCNLN